MPGPQEVEWVAVGWLVAVGPGLLSSQERRQNNKKKLGILRTKIKLAPKERNTPSQLKVV